MTTPIRSPQNHPPDSAINDRAGQPIRDPVAGRRAIDGTPGRLSLRQSPPEPAPFRLGNYLYAGVGTPASGGSAPRSISIDRNCCGFGMGLAVIRGPIEGDHPALRREREEGDERVRGNRREQIHQSLRAPLAGVQARLNGRAWALALAGEARSWPMEFSTLGRDWLRAGLPFLARAMSGTTG